MRQIRVMLNTQEGRTIWRQDCLLVQRHFRPFFLVERVSMVVSNAFVTVLALLRPKPVIFNPCG